MKRRREVAIVLGAFKSAGLPVNDEVKRAIENGLKQVRREKYRDSHKIKVMSSGEVKYVPAPTNQKR